MGPFSDHNDSGNELLLSCGHGRLLCLLITVCVLPGGGGVILKGGVCRTRRNINGEMGRK